MQKELVKTTVKESPKFPLKSQVQEILALIAAFSNLLVKETDALKKSDFKTVDSLQPDKKLFAKQYDAKVTALFARKDEFLSLDIKLREKLVAERARFGTILNDNMRALELAHNSTKRLVNRILEAARQAVTHDRETNYSNAGKALAYKSASMSINLDQNL